MAEASKAIIEYNGHKTIIPCKKMKKWKILQIDLNQKLDFNQII